ncbi:histone-lysine N-methyltransferase NSD2 [Fopius arisanus]|uniref:Histone-lysine N-methyltransferase NSD2 n=1 Tax=Fopius arisanus TaxID=64838 RepID=A0A9R1TWK0_9HYME|nr:PREDICTED: histone-lysine N-methyltransferase NSD2 [Fopius arisanus]
MTRSVVGEPDQDNQSDVPVQKCFVPGETSKLAKNMDSASNGITTRYGRAVKLVLSGEDHRPLKISKPPVTESPVSVKSEESDNGATPETGDKNKIKEEKPEEDVHEVKQEPPVETLKLEGPEPKEEMASSSVSDETTENGRWAVGQLAWAHVSNYPYWPCIVSDDPVEDTHLKQKPRGQRIMKMVHVTYFGDNGRHNWVNESALMEFKGLDDFNALAAGLLKGRKKTTKFNSGFLVKTVIKNKWDTAVTEAEVLLPLPMEERFRAMNPKRKRGRPRLSEDSAAKRPRLEVSQSHKSLEGDTERIKTRRKSFEEINLTSDTPPTPPSSIKDSSDESSIGKKHKRQRRTTAEKNEDFENYYNLSKDNKEYVPSGSEESIREYLRGVWDSMTPYARSKYKKHPNDLHSKEKSSTPEGDAAEVPSTRKSKGSKDPKDSKESKDKLDISIDSVKRPKQTSLFKGVKAERVCQICEKAGNLTRCKGPCYSYFHLKCVKPGESESECDDEDTDSGSTASEKKSRDEALEEETFKCIDCLSGVAPACFVCNEREDDRIRCGIATCGKYYHSKCLKVWPQSHWHGGRLTCPYHMCHTCISDNPQNHHLRIPHDKLARCVRCPSAYHASAQCLPAGSQILTSIQVVCPKHYVAPHPPLNAAWCFLCTRGGSLICCDTCPTSFHPECLGIAAPDGAFICEDCETGRLPLYGEVVWVKLGMYRWWPSRICYPYEVPSNLTAVAHSPGEFCVMFLGTKNYYWVHRGRVFLYQEGDTYARNRIGTKTVDNAYKRAVFEANELHQEVKNERAAAKEDESKRYLKPPPYVKLRVNKPVGNVKPMEVESMVACECDPNWEDPCAPDSDCLNRILSIECNPTICPAGSKCNNQSFVRRKYPLMEPFHTTGRGWGLRALEAIRNGQFIIEYVGEVIDEAEYKRRLHRKKEMRNENYYFLTIDNFRTIDAEPKGNLSRFMNHSCQPNCETQKWTVNGDTRIGLFALKDIDKGEELTFNYNLATEGETKKPCLCGASNCSGYIGLKAQKPQLSVVQQTKIEKAEKVKRQRKTSKKIHKCWTCGKVISGDSFIECGMKSCCKRYHTKCVKRADRERVRCSWHHCRECDKRTSIRCLLCSAAYCQSHLEGKMVERKDKNGYLCKVHENSMGEGEASPEDSGTVTPEDSRSTPEDRGENSEGSVATPEDNGATPGDSGAVTPEEPSNVPREDPRKKGSQKKKNGENKIERIEHDAAPADVPRDKPEMANDSKGVGKEKGDLGKEGKVKVLQDVDQGDIKDEEVQVMEVDAVQVKEVEEIQVMEVEDDSKDEVLSIPETKFDSDEEFDAASLLADSDSSIRDEDVIPPRVSIIQIDLSDEDDMKRDEEIDIKPEDEDIDGMDLQDIKEEDIVPASVKRRQTLRNHQTHRIISGVVPS